MCSNFPRVVSILVVFWSTVMMAQKPITICADPQNPPFSSRDGSGFENKIATILGAEMHRPVHFYWARMGRGFVREVVNKGSCDVVAAVPVGMRGLLVTQPYYRSTYVFVTR